MLKGGSCDTGIFIVRPPLMLLVTAGVPGIGVTSTLSYSLPLLISVELIPVALAARDSVLSE